MRIPNLRMKVAALIAFTVLCLLTFVYLYQSAGGRLPWYDPFTLKAIVPEPLNMVPNADLRMNGIKVGRVKSVEPRGTDSELVLEIDKDDQDDVYRDARIRVRTKTLVGESYVDLDPGTPAAGRLKEGSGLPLEAADEIVPLERILSAVDPKTRRNTQRMLRGLGAGMKDREDELNQLFGAIKPTVADGGALMEALAPQRRDVAEMIDSTGQVLDAFGTRSEDLRTLIVSAKGAAEAAASRDAKLRESLDELPPTLRQADSSVALLSDFSTRSTPVFADLRTAAVDLAPAIRDLEPTARSARTLFRELRPFLDRTRPLFGELRPASGSLEKVIPGLDAFLRQVNPFLQYVKPFAPETTSFFANNGAIFARDAFTARARVFPMASETFYAAYPQTVRDLYSVFLESSGLGEIFDSNRLNPYPAPGSIGSESDWDGRVPKVPADN